MDKRQSILLGLIAFLVVCLYFLSVGIGSGAGSADPEDSGGLVRIESFVGKLPGLSRSLTPDDMAGTPCFDGESFELDENRTSCSFAVPAEVDRLVLRPLDAACRISVDSQPGIGSQNVSRADANDAGDLRIGLSGGDDDAVDVMLSLAFGTDECTIELG